MAMSETGLIVAPRIPRGLAPAVERLTREILRHQPQDIYTFAAHHFEQLVELRDNERASVAVSKICDRVSSNEQNRIILDWIGRNKDHRNSGSNDRRNRFSDRKIEELLVNERIRTSTKLSRKREETVNRSGWSIHETVKTFNKKHTHKDNVDKRKPRNTRLSGKLIEKEIHSYPEERSPRLSKTRHRYLRSSSVGDIYFGEKIRRQHKERSEKLYNYALDVCTRSTFENIKRNECKENYGNVPRLLKRQKSAGQIEGRCSSEVPSECRYHVEPKRALYSPVNASSRRKQIFNAKKGSQQWEHVTESVVNTTLPESRNRRGRHESWIKDQHRDKKIFEGKTRDNAEELRHAETVVVKLSSRSDNNGSGGLKDNERTEETFDRESWYDSKGIDVLDDTNLIVDSRISADDAVLSMKGEDSCNPDSVALPSVITRSLSFNKHFDENIAEQNVSNNLILPPIVCDTSKPIKREDNLTLPLLSQISEAAELNQRSVTSDVNRVSNVEDEIKVSSFEIQNSEANDRDCNSADPGCRTGYSKVTTIADDREEESKIGDVDIDIVSNTTTVDRGAEIEEIFGESKMDEVEEIFKDSLNVTPDLIEQPQRPDSLDHPDVENSTTTMIDTSPKRHEEQSNKEKQGSPVAGNELKNKLIEIETVERNIENALISSGNTGLITDNDPMLPLPTNFPSDSESKESSVILDGRTHAILVTDARSDDTRMKEDVSTSTVGNQCRFVGIPQNDDTSDVENDSAGIVELSTTGKTSNASTTFSSSNVDIDAEQSVVRKMPDIHTEDTDLSCYILTEGSPCEIPESVTTVIIPDKGLENDDEVFQRGHETINDTASRPRRSQKFDENSLLDQDDANPFGEYVYPETFQYSTNFGVNFLQGTENIADQTITHKDLGNIQEEEDNEMNVRCTELSSDRTSVESYSSRQIESTGMIEDKDDVKLEMKEIGSTGIDRGVVDVVGTSSSEPTCTVSMESEPPERQDPRQDEDAPTEDVICLNQVGQREATNTNDCSHDHSSPSDAVVPYVPELNLDSFRDVTISSVDDGSGSMNRENQSEKENDCNHFLSESEKSLSPSDIVRSDEMKPTIDQVSLPEDNFFYKDDASTDHEDRPVEHKDTNRSDTIVDVDDKNRTNSPNIEEEIARELIGNLAGETLMLQETDATETAASSSVNDSSDLNCSRNDRDDTIVSCENRPTASTVTIEPVADAFLADTSTKTNCQQEQHLHGDVQEKEEKEGGEEDDGKVEATSVYAEYSAKNNGVACIVHFLGDHHHQSEESKELRVDSNTQNETLDAAARVIQSRVREFLLCRRRRLSIESHKQHCRQDTQNTTTKYDDDVTSSLSRQSIQKKDENITTSSEECCESFSDQGKCKEFVKSEMSEETKDEEVWPMVGTEDMVENKQTFVTSIASVGSRHTGEFHDSLPLPVLELPKNRVLSLENRTLKCPHETAKPLITLKPGTSYFDSESSQTCVLWAFDFAKSFRLANNESEWCKCYVNLPACMTHNIEPDFDRTSVTDDTIPTRLAEQPLNSDIEDIREPLALDGMTNLKSILIEEISTADEENQQRTTTDSRETETNSTGDCFGSLEKEENPCDRSVDEPVRNTDVESNVYTILDPDISYLESTKNTDDQRNA